MAANHKKAIARRRSADPGGDDVPYLMGDNTLMIGTDYGLGRPVPSANRLGQAARPARRRGDHEQEVVELSLKVPVRDEQNKKQERLELKV